jgi:hypothetical protein
MNVEIKGTLVNYFHAFSTEKHRNVAERWLGAEGQLVD